MLSQHSKEKSKVHTPGLLRHMYQTLRGREQVLVRPAADLPLVLITYPKGDGVGAGHFREILEDHWLMIPGQFRARYQPILESAPHLMVVLMHRHNVCDCLGHHHPPGTESRLTHKLRNLSGVRTGEMDLAYEAIRQWEPLPLSHLALPPEADSQEFASLQWQLALLAVFLHEIHHMVQPQDSEFVVRTVSQKFYTDCLSYFVAQQFGVEFGLRRAAGD
ncbi:MAG: hypothetical protein A3F68_10510 [Acidobacteria bacterium RIFCSPLOWO2_12_FULL_54_10]|nr:MAG: hypothetical protein A3F68_10510 [Acidobacteria bacterium RIFCSPLOWO2_12_FULL_54_10]